MKKSLLGSGKNKNLSKNSGTYAILFISLFAVAFFGVCTPSAQNGMMASGNAASVDGDDITEAEFRRMYNSQAEQMRQRYGDQYDPMALRIAHQTIDQLVSQRIMYKEALTLGLDTADTEIIELVASAGQFKDKGKFSRDAFRSFLVRNDYNEKAYEDELRRALTLEKLRNFVMTSSFVSSKSIANDYKLRETKLNVEFIKLDPTTIDLAISDKEVADFVAADKDGAKVKAYFESHRSEFETPEKMHARHILISYQDARNAPATANARNKEEARKKAGILLAELKAGKDFVALTKEETDEPGGKDRGGDLGFFSRETMVKEFADAAFALKPQELSGIVESPFGFHLIQALERTPEKKTTLADATPGIAKTLLRKERGPKMADELATKLVDGLKQKQDMSAVLATHQLKWDESGTFAVNARQIPKVGAASEIIDAVTGLKTAGQMVDHVLKDGTLRYIVRLKNRTEADMSKLTPDVAETMAQSAAYTSGYMFFSTLNSELVAQLEEKKKIYRNPKYLAIDMPQQQDDAGVPQPQLFDE